MGLDLKYIFANQPPVLPDFSSLPQKHIADLFKVSVIKSHNSYYWHKYKEIGLAKGLRYVESGPLVRSSYHAEKHLFDF